MTFRLGRVDPDTRLTQMALAPAAIAVCGPRRGDQERAEMLLYNGFGSIWRAQWALADEVGGP